MRRYATHRCRIKYDELALDESIDIAINRGHRAAQSILLILKYETDWLGGLRLATLSF